MSDYLPRQEWKRLSWMQNFSNRISTNPGAYGLTAGDAMAIASAVDAFSAAYPASVGPDSSITSRQAKNDAEAAANDMIRPARLSIFSNPNVSQTDKEILGLFPIVRRSGFGKPPVLTVLETGNLSVKLTYADPTDPKRSKAQPEMYYSFCRVWAKAEGGQWAPFADITHAGTEPGRTGRSLTPFTIGFRPPFRGGRVFFKAQWVKAGEDSKDLPSYLRRRGREGDVSRFGPIVSAFIPIIY